MSFKTTADIFAALLNGNSIQYAPTQDVVKLHNGDVWNVTNNKKECFFFSVPEDWRIFTTAEKTQASCPGEKFWMVWNPAGKAPTHKHEHEQWANQEAERLATTNPGHEFIILEATRKVKSTSIQWQPLTKRGSSRW